MPTDPMFPVRIYVSAPRDADAEREILARRLPEQGAELGVEFLLIDPLADSAPDGKGWDLARRFEAIESCNVFLGLVALGNEISESEIRFVLDSPEPPGPRWPKSFFYLRSPKETKPDNAALRDLVRASGRPVFEGYADPEAFADRVLADLRAELTPPLRMEARDGSFSVSGAELPQPPPETPLPLHEDVRFSLYRPRIIAPLDWYPLVVFAHLDELSSELSDEDREAIRAIEEQAREAFAEVPQGFSGESEDSRLAVPDEAEITFVPEIPGVRFNPPRATFLWLEPLHREDFRLQASAALDGKTARGRLSVFLGNLLLAEMNLKIQVDRRAAAAPVSGAPLGEREDARPYHNIFASYSHKDTAIVEEFERYIRALGDRYLIDRETLRAGEVWDDRLQGMIREADIFQLFWSRNAMQSTFVEQEWRYALSLGRDNFIRPTYWEDPLPELPERGLPPQELKRLHFHRFGGLPPADRAAPASAASSPPPPQMSPPEMSPPEMAPPQTAPPSPPSRGRKLLWASSAAALLFVCLTVPSLYLARDSPTVAPIPHGKPNITPVPPRIGESNKTPISQGQQAGPPSQTAQEALQRARDADKLAEGKFLYETVLSDDKVKFGFDTSELSPEAKAALDKFAEQLKSANMSVYIEVQGHTDNVGSDRHNQELGRLRAESVREYLTRQYQFPMNRITVISYGGKEPIADNKTREGRNQNRRVVLVVLR